MTGLEWNVRVSGLRNPDVVAKMAAVFESYWESDDFVAVRPDGVPRADGSRRRLSRELQLLSPTEIDLRPFQERLLEQIEVARHHGHHRNLLVAATGTGKTVMAAVDYARLRERCRAARLLFVAHRQEILEQSRATFRHALARRELRRAVGRPAAARRASSTSSRRSRASTPSGSSASTRRTSTSSSSTSSITPPRRRIGRCSSTSTRVELLGLTATPERADGLDVLRYFDGRIAAELRVWDAIDQQYLVPFTYYGIHDGLDLTRGAMEARHGLRRRRA